ncbi:restriction endonuclease subunit S [Olsenella sp. TM06-36]|uniref:restriction endonuclease subunit S n=4 Tax=unclassified Olsenella TaxID=2638792 RepID=UPI001313F2C4|nr:restriction endonuclease subunit S [Olsenella sp. TM06-36]
MMKARDLKNSILQLAVEGKLVPQDPNDEPASMLLERIREQKRQLIAEGKAKFPKGGESVIFTGSDGLPYEKRVDAKGRESEPVCIADEVPFEVPESWEWIRFSDALINRDAERVPVSVAGREKLDKVYDYYGASGVIDKVDRYLFDTPLLLIGEDGANLLARTKPIAFMARGKFWVNNHAHVLDGISEKYLEYIALYINSISLAPYVTGTAQPKMNQARMGTILIPIPPECEQTRILAKVSELMPLAEEYGALEDERERLDAALPEALRKSVLQQAVEGRLEAQDPADEPASELLARIRGERRRLVAKGELKFPKCGESVIFTGSDGRRYEKRVDAKGHESEPVCIEDEIPFEVPEGWEWARLGALVDMQAGKNIAASKIAGVKDADHPYPCFGGNGVRGFVSRPNRRGWFPIIGRQGARCGCINYAKGDFYATEHAVVVTCSGDVSVEWCGMMLEALNLNQYATATAQPGLAVSKIAQLLVPLPPLAEQRRIVERVQELFETIE